MLAFLGHLVHLSQLTISVASFFGFYTPMVRKRSQFPVIGSMVALALLNTACGGDKPGAMPPEQFRCSYRPWNPALWWIATSLSAT
ncbi:hypothetical protein NON20_01940 [Synechocystis sp. B12]|nr:hypothetical protein NON20_01940 [Synechocystis sp. B12]